MLPILLATYGAVFVAEIAGDKLLYTTGVLATRYRTTPILCGMAIAFMAKMGVAVPIGKGALAASAGAGIRRWIQQHLSPNALRYAAVGLLLLLGLLSVIETMAEGRQALSFWLPLMG